MKNSTQRRKDTKTQLEPVAFWTAAGSVAPRRFGTEGRTGISSVTWLAKAVSPLRFATALQNLCAFAPLRQRTQMYWIARNLWLIPALPALAAVLSAFAQSAGTECRQKVAHGVSRGHRVGDFVSPGGAKESVYSFLAFGCCIAIARRFLSPLPGLGYFWAFDPRLAPWATHWRCSAAIP